MLEQTKTGTVKSFNNNKGYGYIKVDGENTEVFIHYSAIADRQKRHLQPGDRVRFVVKESSSGQKAMDVESD